MYVMIGREDQGLRNNHQRGKKARNDENNFSPDKNFLQNISDYPLSGFFDNEPGLPSGCHTGMGTPTAPAPG
jgi:hypothetical protein